MLTDYTTGTFEELRFTIADFRFGKTQPPAFGLCVMKVVRASGNAPELGTHLVRCEV